MLDVGAIKPSKSAWCNAVVLVQKKDRGLRFCIDFQRLNAQTEKDAFPLHQIHDTFDTLSGSKYYTTIDLLSGFWQTPVEESSKQYTAFTVGTLGFFQCERIALWAMQCSSNLPAIDDQLFGGVELFNLFGLSG